MRKLKSVLSLFLQYAFCVFTPILSVILLSNLMLEEHQEKVLVNRQNSVDSAFESMQERLEDIQDIVKYIGSSDRIQRYVYNILGNKENSVEDYLEIIDMLKLFEVSADISEIYLYDGRENRIITTEAMLSDAKLFFKYGYQVTGKTAEECLERLKSLPTKLEYSEAMSVTYDDKTTEVIECSVNVPFGLTKNYPLHLVVVIETRILAKELYDVIGEEGELYVYDQSGKLILSYGDKYESLLGLSEKLDLSRISDKEDVYGGVLHAQDGNYQIKIYIPDGGEAQGEGTFVILLMVLAVLMSMIFCIYFTARNHREIESIMDLLGRHEDKAETDVRAGSYGYIAIKKNVDRLVKQNAAFLEQLARLNELEKYQFLNKLLHSENTEVLKEKKGLDLGIKDGQNIVLCIRYENADYRSFVAENVTVKDFVKMFLKENIGREIEMLDPSAKEMICIIYGVDQDNADILMRDIVAKLNIEVFYAGGIQVVMGVSNVMESIYQINGAYHQAKEVINYRKMTGKNVLMYSEIGCLSADYFYPDNFDDLLTNYVIARKAEEAKSLLEQLHKENYVKRMLTVETMDKIKSRILDSLSSVADQYEISVQEIVEQLKREKNVKLFFAQLSQLIDAIDAEIGNKRKQLGDSVVTKILNYLNQNYMDSGLSLSMIAYELGFQKDYISKMFKAEYGENFSVVLEKIRIEKACELLKNTDVRVVDVSESVGYNSDISFRRAFKKVTGLSPSEYRER